MKNLLIDIILALITLVLICSIVVNGLRLLDYRRSHSRKPAVSQAINFPAMRAKLIEQIEAQSKQTPNQMTNTQ